MSRWARGAWFAVSCAAVWLATSCMPLPPQSSIDVGAQSDQWNVRWDSALGSPAYLLNRSLQDAPGGRGTAAISDSAAEAAVREVFRDHALWFQARPGVDEFRVVRSYTRGWLRYVRFEQVYRGVSVAGAGYEANVLANGRVGSIEGQYHPNLTLDVTPLLSAQQAEDRARSLFTPGAQPPPNVPAVQFETENGFNGARVLAVVPLGGRYTLAWGVIVPSGANERVRVYVDAREGTVLARQFVGWIGQR